MRHGMSVMNRYFIDDKLEPFCMPKEVALAQNDLAYDDILSSSYQRKFKVFEILHASDSAQSSHSSEARPNEAGRGSG